MATTISTQDLENARRDIDDIGKAVNENTIVDPRYGEDFKSLPMISAEGQAIIDSFSLTAQNTINEWDSAINLITQEGGVPALAVSNASGENQQDINDYGGAKWRNKAGGYNLNARVILENGDIVKSTVANNTANPNSNMAGWVFTSLKSKSVETISQLIALIGTNDGDIVKVQSYHAPNYALADPYMGGDKFIWKANVSKSLHDGGYVIDPLVPIPSLATFNTYYTAVNSANGVWVRLSDSNDILAENYGMSQSASAVWNCSSVQKALFKAASTNPHKRVMLPVGAYRTTNPIILSKYTGSAQSGNTYRVPALIGKGRFTTELAKVTKNTVGAGYQCGDIDAVVVCSPKTGEDQIFGEETGGFGLMRYASEALDSGYGYFSMNAPYGNRYDMRMNRAGVYGYWQDNCWMSTVKQINAISCKNGVAIRGGTSVNGTNIYADTCSQIGIDLYGLTYSNLTVHADRCGGDTASTNGYPAIRANLTKGVTVTASIEHHRGADFEVKQSDGFVVNAGRSIGVGAVPITAATSKVILEDAVVVFNGFSWRYALDGLTAPESGLYSFLTKTGNSVTYEFNGCQGNAAWNDFPLQVSDSQYYGKKTYSGYSENNRIVTSRVGHNSGSFKRWFYAGDASSRVRVLSAMAEGSDQYYDFTALVVVGGISTNVGTPSTLTATRYASGVVATGIDIQAYRNTADGWVYIKPSAGGANLVFNYVLIK